MKTSEMVSPMCLAMRLNGAVLAKRAGDVGRLMREYTWVGQRMGRARMIEMAHEVERLARVDPKHRAMDLDRPPAATGAARFPGGATDNDYLDGIEDLEASE